MAVAYALAVFFGTAIANLLFRKWFDIVLWPRVADWWASRSQARLRKRIEKLEALLAEFESLPLLTEFEEVMLIAVCVIFRLMGSIPGMMFSLYTILRALQDRP